VDSPTLNATCGAVGRHSAIEGACTWPCRAPRRRFRRPAIYASARYCSRRSRRRSNVRVSPSDETRPRRAVVSSETVCFRREPPARLARVTDSDIYVSRSG